MKRIGQLKLVTVWLVLLGFFCGVIGPSESFAVMYREIDTEGDPGDGMDYAGGGSGFGDLGDQLPQGPASTSEDSVIHVVLIPVFVNGDLVFHVELMSLKVEK